MYYEHRYWHHLLKSQKHAMMDMLFKCVFSQCLLQVAVSDTLYRFIDELWSQNAPIGELRWSILLLYKNIFKLVSSNYKYQVITISKITDLQTKCIIINLFSKNNGNVSSQSSVRMRLRCRIYYKRGEREREREDPKIFFTFSIVENIELYYHCRNSIFW